MDGPAEEFANQAPGVHRLRSVEEGAVIHEYRGWLADVESEVRFLTLAPGRTDEAVVEAFTRVAGQWQNPSTHPAIVTVHERGDTPRPWLATASPGGTPLGSVQSELSLPEIRTIIADTSEALRNAHLYNTTHLDLRPAHVYVDSATGGDVEVCVDEWGLKRACRVAAGHPSVAPHTAPELLADPDGGDERTDVYGLGAITYYALTGQPPDRPDDGTATPHENLTPPSTLSSAADVTDAVDEVVLTALAPDPADRYEFAYAFNTAFRRVLSTTKDTLPANETESKPEANSGEETAEASDEEEKGTETSTTRQGTDTQTQDHQPSTDDGQTDETGPPSGTATQTETASLNNDGFHITRRRVVLAIGGIAASSIGWLRFQSGSDREPDPGVASTATPTLTPEPTPTTSVTKTTAEPDSPTPTQTTEPEPTETSRETPVSTDGVSMFRYNAANTGTRSDVTGPTSYMVEQWTLRAGRKVISSPTVVGETVYIGTNDGFVYALDAADGTEEWSFQTNDRVRSSPAVTDGTVYIGSDDGHVYAIDASEGVRKWSYQTGGAVFSSPAVVDGSVYIGSNDRQIYALDAADGTEEWSFQTNDRVRSSPAMVDGTTYVGSDDGNLYAIDAADGTRDWRFKMGATVYSSPTVADETVYIGNHNTSLYAVGSEFGVEQWSFQGDNRIFSSPAVASGTVCVGSGNDVYGVDASDGSEEWSFSVNGTVRSSPAIADGTVYIGSNKSNLTAYGNTVYGIDLQDGTRETAFETFGDIQSSPAVASNTLYVGSSNGTVYGLTEN